MFGKIVAPCLVAVFVFLIGILGSESANALARYECHGITKDTVILTPYADGSVTLTFNNEIPVAKSIFSRAGNVFVAEFRDLAGKIGAEYVIIIDTISGAGYEFVSMAPKFPAAVKMNCYYFGE